MNQKLRLPGLQKAIKQSRTTVILLGITFFLTNCFSKQDRTTTVYGTITDHNGQPVDSILIVVQGLRDLTYEELRRTYSDKNGMYEMIVEVPKKYNAVNSGIPSFPIENRKFERFYKGYEVFQDGKSTSSCCFSSIGEKANYDFQLISK
ncbi:hypothetical protein [Dyadobacter arcticus]|uniref:Carboxypeptidase regulatory-like domain-containing protein n=1 Tax=Dyadobacter arcticus TaxID=1078754 RepID=A0ABX0UNN2_9BACT|nr:hypothetical protein [Dyadobacter arcticus]NIJ53075.1 hypothetical protein [Dyadobacter arcticus]